MIDIDFCSVFYGSCVFIDIEKEIMDLEWWLYNYLCQKNSKFPVAITPILLNARVRRKIGAVHRKKETHNETSNKRSYEIPRVLRNHARSIV